jgi:hypothetical protein
MDEDSLEDREKKTLFEASDGEEEGKRFSASKRGH